MYYLYKKHDYKPSEVHSMPQGELKVLRAFMEKEIEDKNEQIKEANKGGGFSCPAMMM